MSKSQDVEQLRCVDDHSGTRPTNAWDACRTSRESGQMRSTPKVGEARLSLGFIAPTLVEVAPNLAESGPN